MTPMDVDNNSETDSESGVVSPDSDSYFQSCCDILRFKSDSSRSQLLACQMIRDDLLSLEPSPAQATFQRYDAMMRQESSQYRVTIAHLSSSPIAEEDKRWHQFYKRATVEQSNVEKHLANFHDNNNTRPVLDLEFAEKWATTVVEQTKLWLRKNSPTRNNETHRHVPATQIVKFLTHGRTPSSAEVACCTTSEAMPLVASGNIIIFTKDQAPINWGGRPIEMLFKEWYKPADFDKETEVTVPQRRRSSVLREKKTIRQVSRKFLHNDPQSESWNLLNLHNPCPLRYPAFLDTPNCQLLNSLIAEVRKTPATILENDFLLSEGGNHTMAHIDEYGYGVCITIHEGNYGFGWLAVTTSEDRKKWEENPLSSDVAEMARYVVLQPGQTVYFPSGTIHFVFRAIDEPTLAVTSDVLPWSCAMQWLRVMKRQELDEFETVGAEAVKHHTLTLETIINQYIELSEMEGIQDHLKLIGGMEKANQILDTITNWESFDPDE